MSQQSELATQNELTQSSDKVSKTSETFPTEDYLDEDKPLRHNVKRQNWCVISMLTPNSFPVNKREQFKDQKILGIKFRGVYDEYSEATARAEQLQKVDKFHNVFVGEIGKWLPFDVDASNMGSEDQVYREKSLNKYMKSYKEALHEEEVEEKQRKESMLKDANVVTEKPEELMGSSKSANTETSTYPDVTQTKDEEVVVVKPKDNVEKDLSMEDIEKLSKSLSDTNSMTEQVLETTLPTQPTQSTQSVQSTKPTNDSTDLEKELEKQENEKVKLQEDLENTKKSLEGLEDKLSTINQLYAKLKS